MNKNYIKHTYSIFNLIKSKKLNFLIIRFVSFILGLLIISTNGNSQYYKPIANVAGLIDGKINIEDLLKSKRIEIWNSHNLKIVSFSLYNAKEKTYLSKTGSAKFSKKMIKEFKKMPPLIILYDIAAIGKHKDTIYLNPIALEVTKAKSDTNLLPHITEYPVIGRRFRRKVSKSLLCYQTGTKIKDKNYTLINQEIHHGWNNKYNYELNSNRPRFSIGMYHFIRCCIKYNSFVIFYKIKAKKTNGFVYSMPMVLYRLR